MDFDYALVNQPTINAVGLTFDSLGELFAQKAPSMDPCAAAPLPAPYAPSPMIQFQLGRCALDSIGYGLFVTNQLQVRQEGGGGGECVES